MLGVARLFVHAACKSLRRDRRGGLTSPVFCTCGSASHLSASCCYSSENLDYQNRLQLACILSQLTHWPVFAGISKYAFVKVNNDTLDFGDTLIGSATAVTTKDVLVTNVSPVWTSWRVEHLDDDRVPQFVARPREGRLAPGM